MPLNWCRHIILISRTYFFLPLTYRENLLDKSKTRIIYLKSVFHPTLVETVWFYFTFRIDINNKNSLNKTPLMLRTLGFFTLIKLIFKAFFNFFCYFICKIKSDVKIIIISYVNGTRTLNVIVKTSAERSWKLYFRY